MHLGSLAFRALSPASPLCTALFSPPLPWEFPETPSVHCVCGVCVPSSFPRPKPVPMHLNLYPRSGCPLFPMSSAVCRPHFSHSSSASDLDSLFSSYYCTVPFPFHTVVCTSLSLQDVSFICHCSGMLVRWGYCDAGRGPNFPPY